MLHTWEVLIKEYLAWTDVNPGWTGVCSGWTEVCIVYIFFKFVLGIFEIQSIQFNVRVNGKGYYQLGQIVCKKWTDTSVILRGTIGIFLYEGNDIK